MKKIGKKIPLSWYILIMFYIILIFNDFLNGVYDGFLYGNENTMKELYESIVYKPNDSIAYTIIQLMAAAVFTFYVYKIVTKPLNAITDSMDKVAKGDLSVRIHSNMSVEMNKIEESFNTMTEQLEHAVVQQQKMVDNNRLLYSNIAHDLKTPMTMIVGYAKILQQNLDISQEKQQYYLETICEQSAHMNELLDTLLVYTRLQNSTYQLHKEQVDLPELLRNSIAQFYPMFEEKQFSLELSIPETKCMMPIDKNEMKRVFQNMLSNMIRHNEPGTKCIVKMELFLNENKESFRIIFADSGAQIADGVRKTLFQPFCVGNESRNTKNGSGLGLSIVHNIIERHGGKIIYKDEWIQGMKAFMLEL